MVVARWGLGGELGMRRELEERRARCGGDRDRTRKSCLAFGAAQGNKELKETS